MRWVVYRLDPTHDLLRDGMPPVLFEFDAFTRAAAVRIAEQVAPGIMADGGRVMSRASYGISEEELGTMRRRATLRGG